MASSPRKRGTVFALALAAALAIAFGVVPMALGVPGSSSDPIQIVEDKKEFGISKTYEFRVPEGSDGGATEVSWQVGDVTVQSGSWYGFDENTGGYTWGIDATPRVINNGENPVIVIVGDAGEHLVAPGETWAAEGGEVHNTVYPPEDFWRGGMSSLAILDEDGVSATGTFAWSFEYADADQTGHWVFTLQMNGNG